MIVRKVVLNEFLVILSSMIALFNYFIRFLLNKKLVSEWILVEHQLKIFGLKTLIMMETNGLLLCEG